MYLSRNIFLLFFFMLPGFYCINQINRAINADASLHAGSRNMTEIGTLDEVIIEDVDENVLLKFFKYDAGQNIFLMHPDYEMIYPAYAQYPYIGLRSEHNRNPRRHIKLEFNCCKVFQACVTEPKLYSLDTPPSVECRCPLQRAYVRNEDCLKAYKRKDLYMRIFSLP